MHHRTKSMFALFMSVFILLVGLNITPVSAGTVYVWNKYNTVSTPQYTQGSWSAWSAGTTTTASFSGSSSFSFNVSSGFVLSGSKTVSKTSPGSVYTGSATGITETNVTSTGVKTTRTCSRLTGTPLITRGTYVAQVFSTSSSAYPANGVSSGYWYVSAPSVQEVFPTVTVSTIANTTVGATISVNATSSTPCYRMSAKYTLNGVDTWLATTYSSSYSQTFTASSAGTYTVTVYSRSYVETDPRSASSSASKSFSVTAAQYTVSYNGNGNTSGTVPTSQTWTAGSTLTLRTNTGSLAKTGYTFAGWNTNSAGTGTTYTAGQTGVNLGNASTTLYAKWTPNTYTATYSGNGSTSGTVPASQTWTAGSTLTLRTNTGSLAKTGYSFAGWNTNSAGTGTTYSAGQTGVNLGNASTTLYAKWNIVATPTPTPPAILSKNIVFSNISGPQNALPTIINPTNTILGKSVDGITMVNIIDLQNYLGCSVTIDSTGNRWIITRNGMQTVFTNNSTAYSSTISYSIQDRSLIPTGTNPDQLVPFTITYSGVSQKPAQIIDGQKYVELDCTVLQLGALLTGKNTATNTDIVFDYRVNGSLPIYDNNTFIVGGSWLSNWSAKETQMLTMHFTTGCFWDISYVNYPEVSAKYQKQLKMSVAQLQCAENVGYYYNNKIYSDMEMSNNSAFRSWEYNNIISSSATSYHTRGKAWDAGKDSLYAPVLTEFENGTPCTVNPGSVFTSSVYPNGASGGQKIEIMPVNNSTWLHLQTP